LTSDTLVKVIGLFREIVLGGPKSKSGLSYDLLEHAISAGEWFTVKERAARPWAFRARFGTVVRGV
jgi:hypothetical protein